MKIQFLVGLLLQWSVGLCDDVDDEIAMVKESVTKSGLGDFDSDFVKSLNSTYLAVKKGGKLQLKAKKGKKHLDIEKVLKQHEKKSNKNPTWHLWVGLQDFGNQGSKVDHKSLSRAVSSLDALKDATSHDIGPGSGCYFKVASKHKLMQNHGCSQNDLNEILLDSGVTICPESAACVYLREEDTKGTLRYAAMVLGADFDAVKKAKCKSFTIAAAGSGTSCSD